MRVDVPSVDSVADAVAELSGALSPMADPAAARAQVRALVCDPLRLCGSHPRWPSQLGDDGLPLELSIKDAGGIRGVRCTVDPCDYSRPHPDRLPELTAAARRCVGERLGGDDPPPDPDGGWAVSPDRLLTRLLAGAPDRLPAPAMLSVGIGDPSLCRASVYARTAFWPAGTLAARLPGPATVLAGEAATHSTPVQHEPEVIGVDYVAGRPTRWKSYHFLTVRPGRFADAVGSHPDLAPAAALYARFAPRVPAAAAARSGFLQVSAGSGTSRQKLFLFSACWGWSTPDGLAELLSFLPSLGAPVDALPLVRRVLARHRIPVRLSMIALGGAPDPSITYYVVPSRPR